MPGRRSTDKSAKDDYHICIRIGYGIDFTLVLGTLIILFMLAGLTFFAVIEQAPDLLSTLSQSASAFLTRGR